MADTPAQHEQVPDDVGEGEAVPEVEDDAEAVAESADAEPDESAGGEGGEEGFDGDDSEPAHGQVDSGGDAPVFVGIEEDLVDDSREGEPPFDAEDRPAPASFEGEEGKGRIGAGDEQVDG